MHITSVQTRKNSNLDADTDLVMRTSKSDTSLTDGFVMVTEADINCKKTDSQNILKKGFRWQRQLVFKNKLTMHTAYDRKDNREPASITALAVSRDHRTIYIGDARGRVFSWSVCEYPGRIADHWQKDDVTDSCEGCGVKFSFSERKHHCRNCGLLFCSRCSRFESKISRLGIFRPVRVCQRCHTKLISQSSKECNTE
ncbi:WD repeat and FYVE domain-containing protein 3-like [Copidosoma floridanum]|uniref:WD repeat and FYVE domain-containing protein 3-like n=1 Tax=Copidosoma floridanum TaxID=29053 RepID=UPI000C6F77D4|nr:WD repeat and FYVE domain-containing protein 3-like [Copidosoma floridanum]